MCRRPQIEVVQHGVAPDAVETGVGEGQAFAIGLNEGDGDAVGVGAAPGLAEITGRQVERSDAGAAPDQDDRRHAVAAAEVEDPRAGQRPEAVEGGTDPGFVVEVVVVAETEGMEITEVAGTHRGLLIVKGLLAAKAIRRRRHGSAQPASLRCGRHWPPFDEAGAGTGSGSMLLM